MRKRSPTKAKARLDHGVRPDWNYSPEEVQLITGDGKDKVYRDMAAGEYVTFKDGRLRKITGQSIIDRRNRLLGTTG
jgi:hypothetical protein